MSLDIQECPICKSNDVVQLNDSNTLYGLVKLEQPATVNFNELIPVHVFCCKKCGYVALVHADASKIKINK